MRLAHLEYRDKKPLKFFKLAIFSMFFFLFSNFTFSQDSIPEKADITEDTKLKFQEFFFNALSQKAIGNYQKAIESLENCNQIIENDVAVFFEFSKNYLLLNNTLLAKEYLNRALEKDVDNIWMLKHLVEIYQRERDFKKAIEIQQKISVDKPNEKEFLVRLYLYDRQYNEAITIMNTIEEKGTLSANLKKVRANLEKRNKLISDEKIETDVVSLMKQFEGNSDYKTLEKILKISEENPVDLLKYSEKGIALFPAQPYVYLMKAKALNYQKNFKNALTTLQNGIDFVFEDAMEADFYNEMAKAYKGLGNAKEEKNYRQKAKKLKR